MGALKRRLLDMVAVVAAAACSAPPRAALAPSAPSAASPPTTDAGAGSAALVPASAAPAAAPSTWITTPPAKAELYVALDGMCPLIQHKTVENADFVFTGHHFFYDTRHTLARITETSLAVSRTSVDTPIDDIGGHYPDALFMVEGTSTRGAIANTVLKLHAGKNGEDEWLDVAPHAGNAPTDDLVGYRLPEAWRNAVLFDEYVEGSGGADPYHRLEVIGEDWDHTPLHLTFGAPGVDMSFRAFSSGELFVVEIADPKTSVDAQLSILMPGKATDTQTISRPKPAAGAPPWTSTFEGTVLGTMRLVLGASRHRFNGRAWVVETSADKAFVEAAEVALAKEEETKNSVRGEPGDRWRTNGYSVEHDTGSGFHPVALPPPPFASDPKTKVKIERAAFGIDDELFVIGSYQEKGRGWKKALPYGVLYRTRRPNETLRCNEPNPEDLEADVGVGFQSWPPIASASCASPFAVLTRKSDARAADGKMSPANYQALARVLAAHPDAGRSPLVEFPSAGRTFAGMKVPDLAHGQALLDLVSRSIPIRGEIVCGEPAVSRVIDLSAAAAGP